MSANPWPEQNQLGAVRYQDGAAQVRRTAVPHPTWEKRHCESVLHCPGEGRDVVAHKGPHVQFWDKKLEGRIGAGLLLSSGLCRHMVII